MDMRGALIAIRKSKRELTRQQIKTLQGQVFSGNIEGAMKGLRTLKQRAAQQAAVQQTGSSS